MKGEFVLLSNLYFSIAFMFSYLLFTELTPSLQGHDLDTFRWRHHGPAAAPNVQPGAALVDLADVTSTAQPPAQWRGARRTPCLRSTASLGPSRSMLWGTPQGTRQGTGRGS